VSGVPVDPDWLSVREVARRLSVHQKLVRKWIHAGQFDEVVYFNQRLVRISIGAYQRFIDKQRAA
jgi:excisionase family DNA binding protein